MKHKKKILCSAFTLLLLMSVLPNGITIIGKHSFYGCINLKSVILPDSVNVIVNYISYVSAYYGLPKIFLPALLVFICIYVLREILMLFKLSNYKKYSKQVFNDIPISKRNEQIINYSPVRFIQDKLFSIFSKVVITLVTFTYIIFVYYISIISITNNWEMNPSFLNVTIYLTICILGGVLVPIVIVALVVWLSYKIRSIISDQKKADIAKVRIRKIDGGKRDDQYNL